SVTIPASPFMQKLGFGTGVNVYLMKRSPRGLSRSPWAVKKISSSCSQSQRSLFQKRLQEEAQKLRKLQHPNIVGYRALTRAPDGSLCLAMEFGGEHSLNARIEERRERGLGAFPAPTILHVALCMARGLQYLHTEQRLLHGDIKSPNVVVRGAFDSVKICDVGVSLPLDENLEGGIPGNSQNIQGFWGEQEFQAFWGFWGWAGNSGNGGGKTQGSFPARALGIFWLPRDLLGMFRWGRWNLLEECRDGSDSFSEESFDEDSYYAALGSRPALPPEAMDPSQESVRELFGACTAREPRQRPAAARIVEALEGNP
ncbi:TOPK kinase, partial [Copsychus sechellarum]|nr:TOPK kinase [Copsychus sechellarum]